MATDFGPREAGEREIRTPTMRLNMKAHFEPATEEEIATYRNTAYPRWLSRCEQMLRDYHRSPSVISGPLTFSFIARNEGTRPANDALVTISAKGGFTIRPPPWRDHLYKGGADARQPTTPELPAPPSPPMGKFRKGPTVQGMGELERMRAFSNPLTTFRELEELHCVTT